MADFGEQAFLLDFIEKFSNETVKDAPTLLSPVGFTSTKPKTYEHVMRMEGDPTSCMNKLLYDSLQTSRMFDLFAPHQLSYLTPRIEIWKNHPTGKKDPKWIKIPFPINQVTTVDSILNSIEGRGTDVALNSISWQDTGTDSAYAGVTMSGFISLSFQSFESLFMDRPTGRVDAEGNPIMISFAQLTTNVPTKLKPEVTGDIPVSFYDREVPPFEIQLVLGWSVPDDAKNEIFSNAQLSAISDAIVVLNILTNRVELKIDDGGKVDLTCQFHGRVETAMHTQRYDLFMLDPKSLDNQERAAHVKVLQDVNKNLRKEQGKIENTESKAYEDIQKNIDITTENLYNIKSESLEAAWSKLLGRIVSMTGPADKDGRLFFIDIDDDTVDDYKTLMGIRAALRQAKREKKNSEANKSLSVVDQKMIKEYTDQISATRKTIEGTIAISNTPGGTRNAHDNRAANKLDSSLTPDQWTQASSTKSNGYKTPTRSPYGGTRINYFFLGDLFEAALDIIINRPETNWDCANPVSGKNNIKRKELSKQSRLLLGTMYMTNSDTGKLRTVSIADLPISLNTFLLWWEKRVVAPRRTTLPLRSFLVEICSDLITAVLGIQAPVADGTRRPSSRVQLSSVDLPKDGFIDTVFEKYKKIVNIEDVARMNKEHRKEKDGQKFETVQFIYLYPRELPQIPRDKKTGLTTESLQYQDNLERGIPHLYVGNRKGMIQRVTFSRTKIEGHLESSILRSVQEGRAFKSQLLSSDKYDANIDMFGNPFYKPGMQIYLDPRSLGLGYSVSREWATDLGLGGMYTIIGVSNEIAAGKYTTKLSLKSEIGLGLRKLVTPIKSTTAAANISDKG